jgi:hypothetical protein
MANAVTIQVVVDDGNSKQTLDALDSSLQNVGEKGSLSIRQLGQNLDKIAPGVESAAHSTERLNGHITTGLDNVRLLGQEFGIRVPRAMEYALARVPALTSALGTMSGVLLGIGGAEIFVHIGEEAYHLYKQVEDVNGELTKYLEMAGKGANDKLFDSASLETSVDLLREANDQIAELEQKRRTAGVGPDNSGSLTQYLKYPVRGAGYLLDKGYRDVVGMATPDQLSGLGVDLAGAPAVAPETYGKKDDARLAMAYANRDKSQSRTNDLGRNLDLDKLKERDSAATASVLGYNQAAEQLQGALKEAAVTQENVLAHERDLVTTSNSMRAAQIKGGMKLDDPKLTQVHVYDPNAGLADRQLAEQKARDAYSAKIIEMSRKERDERIAAQNDAVNSGLEGEALYSAKMEQSIASVTRKFQDGEITRQTAMAETAAIAEKFENEEGTRIQKQVDDAKKMLEQAQTAGLTGANRVVAEHNARIGEINTDRTLDPQAASIQRQAAAAEANNKLKQLDDDFTRSVQESTQERTADTINGFAKIDAAAQAEHDKLKKLYDDTFNAEHPATPAQQKQYQDAGGAIDADAATKKRDLQAKNAQDDLASAREAAQAEARVREQGVMGWASSYKDAIAEIQMQEQQRLAKLEEDAQKEGLTWQEAAQRREDIDRTANAQIAEQNAQLQHTIAGQLQQAFTDPTTFIKQKMEQMFFEILASWMMRLKVFKGVFGDTMGGMQPGAPGAMSSPSDAGVLTSAARNVFGIGHGISTGVPAGTRGFIPGGTSSTGASTAGGYGFPASSPSSTSLHGVPASSSGSGYSSGTWSSPEATFPTSGGGGSAGGFTGTGGSYSPVSYSRAGNTRGASSGTAGIGGDIQSVSGDAKSLMSQFGLGKSATVPLSGVSTNGDGTTVFGDGGIGGGGTSGLPGDADQAGVGAASGLSTALGVAGAVGGAYAGTEGVLDSFHQGGLTGALHGAMSGAEMGAAIGSIIPGLGTLIGGVAGAVVGLGVNLVGDVMGESGRFAARDYYKATLFPQMEQLESQFNSSGGDYLSAISQANSIEASGMTYMSQKWGADAASWVKSNYLDKEAQKVVGDITRQAAGGSEYTGRTAAEFHTGGQITNFHDFSTSSTEGFIHAMLGEGVVNTSAMSTHAPMVHAMNSGADAAQMASMYLQASGSRSGGAGSVNYHTHNYSALDAKSFGKYLDSGGMKTINDAANRRASLYAGDAIG